MKGGNIVALESLREVYREFGEIYNVDFLLVSDEESGSDDSKYVTMSIAKDYDYCFVFEASGESMEVVTGRKGVGTFTIDIEGRASHAGNKLSRWCQWPNLRGGIIKAGLELDKGFTKF